MRIFPVILAALAVAFVVGGVKLIAVGGSWFYAGTGVVLAVVAVLLWRGSVWGARLYGALLAATVGWALWEVGLDGWGLLPRVWLLAVLGVWLLLPGVRRRLSPVRAGRRSGQTVRGGREPSGAAAAIAVAALVVLAAVGLVAAGRSGLAEAGVGVPAVLAKGGAAGPAAGADWATYGGVAEGTRFSTLGQITPANVAGLRVAWTYHVGEAHPYGMEVTPLKVGDAVYLCTGANVVVALDAQTGAERWRYDAKPRYVGPCRGVAYYAAPGARGPCAEAVYMNTFDARLIALDARTGRLCAGFGHGGEVSLTEGMRPVGPAQYLVSSAPTVARGRLVIGGVATAVKGFDEPSGVIRAYDAVTGQLAWAYDAGQPERTGAPPAGSTYTVGMPNAWAPMAYDDTLGLVYVPTATGGAFYYGGQRRPVDDAISTAVMALDVQTGRPRWVYQMVHHDLWDYDIGSQPMLVDLPGAAGTSPASAAKVVKALVQPTKMGETYVLDRATGVPIAPVVERPVPQAGKVPEERLSATQPFPASMPSLAGGLLTERSMWGLTPFDQMWCRIRFREVRYDGIMTPPGLTASLQYPGWLGGMDWGSASMDLNRGVMVAVTNYVADVIQMRKLGPPGSPAPKLDKNDLAAYAQQADVPYANSTIPFMSPAGVPCQQPPWSRLTAMDLVHRRVLWSRPLGTGKDTGPFGLRTMLPLPIGVPALGGSLVTGSGLTFVSAAVDRTLRAFDTVSGRVLWQADLPASGNDTPITYQAADGRQMVLIAATGHKLLGGVRSDAVIAYALPR